MASIGTERGEVTSHTERPLGSKTHDTFTDQNIANTMAMEKKGFQGDGRSFSSNILQDHPHPLHTIGWRRYYHTSERDRWLEQ